jgi:CubicO group peptidase (beta-lactamase class C family)
LPAVIVTVLAGCTSPAPSGGPPAGGSSTPATASTSAASGAGTTAAKADGTVSPVDPAALEQGLSRMLSGGERYERLIKSVVIQVGGEVVASHYAADSGPTVTHNGRSVTKSVMSMLIGIAIADGAIPGIDATLAELLPDRAAAMAPGMGAVTLHQILSMTAGIPEDELFNDRYGPTADWTAVTLSTGLVHPPGTAFAYASAGSHLLSAILVQATGRSVLDYARDKLFDPLAIATQPATEATVDMAIETYDSLPGFAWTVDPTGLHLGFTDLKLTAPDMAKLGQLYLQHGVWEGAQLVPADWVAESTRVQVEAVGQPYGYQWWVLDLGGRPAFAAFGFAGQLIEVVPDLDLVVAVSCKDDPARFDPDSIADLVATWIVPAVAG